MTNEGRAGLLAVGLATLVALGCARTGWPEEPGVPVVASQVANIRAADAFVEKLTSLRRGEAVPEPIVTPKLQGRLRTIADKLGEGRLSANQALQFSEKWGRKAYRCDVDAWVLDCSAGADMWLPPTLVDRPTAVMSYAAVHFRPRSASADQCAILVVRANGTDSVSMKSFDERVPVL